MVGADTIGDNTTTFNLMIGAFGVGMRVTKEEVAHPTALLTRGDTESA